MGGVNDPYPRRGGLENVANLAEIREELNRILTSRRFRSARAQRRFLEFIVEEAIAGRGGSLKELVIGSEALERGKEFDPRLDPIVRTEARKLRIRLDRYYAEEGLNDPIRIALPKGAYEPVFLSNLAQPDTAFDLDTTEQVGELAFLPLELQAAEASLVGDSRPPGHRPRLRTFNWKLTVVVVAVVGLAGLMYAVLRSRARPEADPLTAASVAVIPFSSADSGRDGELLADGMTDGLIRSLARVPDVRVVARTSAFSFRGEHDIAKISEALHVRTVLTGTVKADGEDIRITVQLLNASPPHPLWSGTYDVAAKDVLVAQRDISQAVARVLGSAMGISNVRPHGELSVSPAAYRNYLRGLHFWNKVSEDALKLAIQYFEQAIADDPRFAAAYSALADCYVMAPQVATAPPLEVISKIRTLATRALELDPHLGAPHFSLAVSAQYEFNWHEAEKEFKKGLELSPGSSVGHLWYAKQLALTGRLPEVLVHRKIAAELDPVSPYAIQSVGGWLSVMGRYEESIEHFQNALTLDPNFGLARQGLGVAYILKGETDKGIAELRAACQLYRGPRREGLLGYAYGVSGRPAEARRILTNLQGRSGKGHLPALAIAHVYIGLGDKDHAFEWLEKAIEQRDLDTTLQWDSLYVPLRPDPRYQTLLRRMRLDTKVTANGSRLPLPNVNKSFKVKHI